MTAGKGGDMAKLLAVTIIVIAIVSAIPVLMNTWQYPENISTHGKMIDDQMSDTMWEAGISFFSRAANRLRCQPGRLMSTSRICVLSAGVCAFQPAKVRAAT